MPMVQVFRSPIPPVSTESRFTKLNTHQSYPILYGITHVRVLMLSPNEAYLDTSGRRRRLDWLTDWLTTGRDWRRGYVHNVSMNAFLILDCVHVCTVYYEQLQWNDRLLQEQHRLLELKHRELEADKLIQKQLCRKNWTVGPNNVAKKAQDRGRWWDWTAL